MALTEREYKVTRRNVKKASDRQKHGLIAAMNQYQGAEALFARLKQDASGRCPGCRATPADQDVIKHGKTAGTQRYKCKACEFTFSENNQGLMYKTQLPEATWLALITKVLECSTLETIVDWCGVCLETAHRMRRKLLDKLKDLQKDVKLKRPVAWADETYKRCAYELRCILTVYDGDKRILEYVATGNASMRVGDASGALDRHLKSAVLITDGNQTYGAYCKNNNIRNRTFEPESQQLEPVDNVIGDFKKFISRFNGVALKFLSGYLALYSYTRNF